MSNNEYFALHKPDCPTVLYSCVRCRIHLFSSKQCLIHDPEAEEGHKLFIKNKHHSRDGKGNQCTSVFADPSLVSWVVASGGNDDQQDAEDLSKYKALKLKKEQQQLKKNKQHAKQNNDDDENEHEEKDENDQDEDDDDNDDEYDSYDNYNYQQQYSSSSGKSHSDDEKDLFCPNERCKVKLGSKQWQGTQCSCGAWVIPAFKVLLSKVDAIVAANVVGGSQRIEEVKNSQSQSEQFQ